jgi:N6-adenosine-specific RNA methylase IME4
VTTPTALPLPPGPWDLVYADPPWRFRFHSERRRRIENHYPTMTVGEIASLPVREIAADRSVLFLWSPSIKVDEALEVLRTWGFRYATLAVWDKGRLGLGFWFRHRDELLLVGVRGDVPLPPQRRRPDSILVYPRTGHSTKPAEVRTMVDRMTRRWARRRIELFARGRPPRGWTYWGDQAVPETGPGRPRLYHFDPEAVRRLRSAGGSWDGILRELRLPSGALRSVRRACATRGGKSPRDGVANPENAAFATPGSEAGP